MGCNEHYWDVHSGLDQFALEIHPTQPWHAHIKHEASWSLRSRVLQKFSGGSKSLDLESGRANKTLGGTTNRQIVINDKHDGLGLSHDEAWLAPGRLTRKLAPAPWFDSAHKRPPWASMIEREIDKPIPMPWGL